MALGPSGCTLGELWTDAVPQTSRPHGASRARRTSPPPPPSAARSCPQHSRRNSAANTTYAYRSLYLDGQASDSTMFSPYRHGRYLSAKMTRSALYGESTRVVRERSHRCTVRNGSSTSSVCRGTSRTVPHHPLVSTPVTSLSPPSSWIRTGTLQHLFHSCHFTEQFG